MKKIRQEIKLINLPDNPNDFVENFKSGAIKIGFAMCDFPKFGIAEGDRIFLQATDKFDENLLTWFSIGGEKNSTLGYYFDNFGDVGISQSDGVSHYKRRYVGVLGVVIGIAKPYRHAEFETVEETAQAQETTVVCGKCEATLSGSPEFLKGMGWKLEDAPLCVNCRF